MKDSPVVGEGRGAGRQDTSREPPPRATREAILPGGSPLSPASREPAWSLAAQHGKALASMPPAPVAGQKDLGANELMSSLGRVRQAFRQVAAVVEGLGALRSLGGEEALIEMAMIAQGHDQTLERVWKAIADCEQVARRLAAATETSETSAPLTTDPAPMPIEELAPDSAVEEEGPVTQVDAKLTRVLVVDDDPAVLRAFRRVLSGEHEIVTALDGSEALRIVLGGTQVDAIICDIGMPKLDGPAFFSELFELRPQLMPRVVFCTGGPPNEKTQRFLDRLQAPLLLKPVSAADLQRAIDQVRTR